MSRFNTGNELGSLDERDLYDNAINLDKAMNSTEPTWRDRFNVEKPTIDAALKSAGFMPAGFDFVTGGTLQPGDRNKAVYNPAPNGDNNWYRWNGVFPKEIAANSQPNPKDENNWVPVVVKTGAVEREALRRTYLEAGYNLVEGSFEQGGVLNNQNDVLLEERTGKAYSGPAGTVAAGTNPVGDINWKPVTDELLRSQLAAPDGVNLVGGAASDDELDEVIASVATISNDLASTNAKLAESINAVRASSAAGNISYYGVDMIRSNIVILGDSFTAGTGSGSTPRSAYARLLGQSLSNFYPDGYAYPMVRNHAIDAIFTHNGTSGTHGLAKESVILTGSSQKITFNRSEAHSVILFVETANTTATSVQLLLNGAVVRTLSVASQLILPVPGAPVGWTTADVIEVNCPSGTLVISGASLLRLGRDVDVNTSPLVITNGASGESFEYYRTNKAAAAALSGAFGGSTYSTYIIALGTNSIYSSAKAQTPSEYVASMLGLESDLRAINPGIQCLFWIPPKASSEWPVIKPGVTYEDYVAAIRSAVSPSKLMDMNIPGLQLSDGVHPNPFGHIAIAKKICGYLDVPFAPQWPSMPEAVAITGNSPVIVTGGRVVLGIGQMKQLVGKVEPNGASGNLLFILAAKYRPSADRYFTVPLLGSGVNGLGTLWISATTGEGRLQYNSIVWTSLYLDGISYL